MSARMNTESGRTAEGAPFQLSQSEHCSLLIDFNDTTAPFPGDLTVVDLFKEQVGRTPDAPAVRCGSTTITYAELNKRANQVAAHLAAIGVGVGSVVMLRLEHSIEAVCAILGILKAGGAYVPLDPDTPPGRLAFVCQDLTEGLGGRIPALLTQSWLLERLPEGLGRVVALDKELSPAEGKSTAGEPSSDLAKEPEPGDLAYVIYTSGSTGTPKGVAIEHLSLVNYVWWANRVYGQGEPLNWPLFSSLAFDLTVTSIFTPLVSGGCIVVYGGDPRVAVLRVVEEGVVDIVKLTPAHLAMVRDAELSATRIRRMIVGGEEFRTELARVITEAFARPVEVFNEYGPTEATVGCMIHRYDAAKDVGPAVPIGVPADNLGVYILDENHAPVPPGVIGEVYVSGMGLARGYLNRPELNEESFLTIGDPRNQGGGVMTDPSPSLLRVYKTGDLARWSDDGQMEFLGRKDHQVKIHGARIELGEIEARLLTHPEVRECVATVIHPDGRKHQPALRHCVRCGVPANLPGTHFDDQGVCNICRSYDTYKDRAEAYFKSKEDLEALVAEIKAARTGKYDCLVLVSGGKDSSYMLYQLCDMGLTPLVFSLDNGYISEEAQANLRRMVDSLGVDLVFEGTPHMNEIFADSLRRFANVCNGCFKTIYTLATNLALGKGIRFIFTGLSRGQFFETRLTEEVFQREDFDVARLDDLVFEARKAYHQRDDAVSAHLAVDVLRGEGVLESIQFVDFYRYVSVPLDELYAYLESRGAWTRPSDTGRSTNCLINDLGIHIHKKQRGFHNYALPYSWDVRLHQKTREEAMEELEDEIDEALVKRMMAEIGYVELLPPEGMERIAAYYVSARPLTKAELRQHLAVDLPDFMIPAYFVPLASLPLTPNGKIDRTALPPVSPVTGELAREVVEPRTDVERALGAIFSALLTVARIGIHDDFFDLGGHSIIGIRAMSRIRETFGVDLPLSVIFEHPTIAGLAAAVADAQANAAMIPPAVSEAATAPIPRQARKPVRLQLEGES